MRTCVLQRLLLGVLLGGLAGGSWAIEHSNTNPITPDSGREIIATTPFQQCANTAQQCVCVACVDGLGMIYVSSCGPESAKGIHPGGHDSMGGSVVDNLSFNHIHYACDYQYDSSAENGCGSCGGGSPSGS